MAENKPNTPEGKKTVPANKAEKNKNTAPGKEPVTADGKTSGKVVVLPVQNKEQEKAAAQDAGKTAQDKTLTEEEKRRQAALKNLDPVAIANKNISSSKEQAKAKAAAKEVVKRIDAANKGGPVKADKAAKDEKKEQEGPSLQERKEKMEQELREKYGIPPEDISKGVFVPVSYLPRSEPMKAERTA